MTLSNALILMGGRGVRFGNPTPKQFHLLRGKRVYLHTLDVFYNSGLFSEILLVCPEPWLDQVKEEIEAYDALCVRAIVGGASRQESSYKGLLACSKEAEIVVIHDAVRPFITIDILRQNIEAAREFGAVDTCIPSTDTLVLAPQKTQIVNIPNREDYLRGQTPQSFRYPLILNAHFEAQKKGICNRPDDCSLLLQSGHPVHIVQGDEKNIKITSEFDLLLAEFIACRREAESPSLQESTAFREPVE